MYVTGGQYKGHKVIIPDCAKPTLSKTRESVFNILYSILGDFNNKIFLDLYAGSGIMSLEAVSRGFSTISVDNNKNAIKLIKENLKISKNSEIYFTKAQNFIKNTDIIPDVIYIDPPWEDDYSIIKECFKFKGAILIIEYDKKKTQELSKIYLQNIVPFREKVYGRCKLDFITV